MQSEDDIKKLSDIELGRILWDYNTLQIPIKPSDIIIILGSNYIRVADYGAFLFNQGLAPLVVVSGGVAHSNDLLATGWNKPEAEVFLERLLELKVPRSSILVEREAQNTGQNIANTMAILDSLHITISSGILVQKPFMQRRAIATAEKLWPEVKWHVTSPDISYENFVSEFGEQNVLNILTGDTWRVIEYPKLGFQTKQEMPHSIKLALSEMIARGYRKHLPNNAYFL